MRPWPGEGLHGDYKTKERQKKFLSKKRFLASFFGLLEVVTMHVVTYCHFTQSLQTLTVSYHLFTAAQAQSSGSFAFVYGGPTPCVTSQCQRHKKVLTSRATSQCARPCYTSLCSYVACYLPAALSTPVLLNCIRCLWSACTVSAIPVPWCSLGIPTMSHSNTWAN